VGTLGTFDMSAKAENGGASERISSELVGVSEMMLEIEIQKDG